MAEQRTRLFVDEITSIALVDRGANVDAAILISKRAEDKMPDDKSVEKSAADRAADAEAQVATLTARVAELEAKVPAPAEDEVLKSLPEAIQKRLEKAEADAAEAIAKANAEENKRTDAEFLAKASELITKSCVPAKADEFGPVLKRIEKGAGTEADFTELYRVIKALGEQVKAGNLFKSAGRSDLGDGESAAGQIAKAADELRKATPMTVAQARVEARRLNPDMAKRERAEAGH